MTGVALVVRTRTATNDGQVPVERNRAVFDSPGVVASYRETGWSDRGEHRALAAVAPATRGRTILDIGVGTGRTTGLLTLISEDYTGIDYAPRMIKAARAAFPGVQLRVADVRDLRKFADATADLVVFSYNGLDSISGADRGQALSEMTRVLRPGGHLVLSGLNLEGPVPRQRPWRPPALPEQRQLRDWAMWAYLCLRMLLELPSSAGNYRRGVRAGNRGDRWAVLPLSAHSYTLCAHFSTLGALCEEVRTAGLEVEQVFGNSGTDLTGLQHDTIEEYFHVVARKGTDPV